MPKNRTVEEEKKDAYSAANVSTMDTGKGIHSEINPRLFKGCN
ncbi:MAG TPA: hypothetical protein VJ729_02735 [Nitrososphaeraceae archaeon]|nr:hypothetical protein [Nitrososphaeraceae archaeon]